MNIVDYYVFFNVDSCSIFSDDRTNNGIVKTFIIWMAEEWVKINAKGFQKNAAFYGI